LPGTNFNPPPASIIPSESEIKSLPRPQKRIAQLIQKHSGQSSPTEQSVSSKSWSLDFLFSPTSFNSSSASSSTLSSLTLTKNAYELGAEPLDRKARVVSTGESIDVPADISFRSVGYKSLPLPGLSSLGITFDERIGIIPNDVHGRVLAPLQSDKGRSEESLMAKALPGLYCAGWVKRGPTGVIASTMDDAFSTADVIVADWENNVPFLGNTREGPSAAWNGIKQEVKALGLRRTEWKDWKVLDDVERERGKSKGKPREKIVNVEEMLSILDK